MKSNISVRYHIKVRKYCDSTLVEKIVEMVCDFKREVGFIVHLVSQSTNLTCK